MANLDNFQTTNLSSGAIANAFRFQVEGVMLENPMYFDASASTNWLTPINGRTNTFVVDDALWMQDAIGYSRPGGMDSRTWFVVAVNGNDIQISATQGGQALDITSDGRTVLSNLVADYRQEVGEEILFAFKTNMANELTVEQRQDLMNQISTQLIYWKAENDGVL